MVVDAKNSVLSSLGFHHDEPELFVTSQWTALPKKTAHFLIFRWVLAGFYVGILSWSWTSTISRDSGLDYWFIYLTNWGLMLCVLSTVYSVTITTLFYCDLITLKPQSALYKVYWLLSNISVVAALLITTVYWSILFNGKTSALDVMVHGGNSIGMLLEICMVRHPIYVVHFVYVVGLGLIYLIFSIVYYFAGGVDRAGNRYIYNVLAWETPGKSTSVAIGVLVLTIFLHVLTWILQKLRTRLHKRIFKENTVNITQETV